MHRWEDVEVQAPLPGFLLRQQDPIRGLAYLVEVLCLEYGLVEDPEKLLHLFLPSGDHTIYALNGKLVPGAIHADNGEAFESSSAHPASFNLRREALDMDHLIFVVPVLLGD